VKLVTRAARRLEFSTSTLRHQLCDRRTDRQTDGRVLTTRREPQQRHKTAVTSRHTVHLAVITVTQWKVHFYRSQKSFWFVQLSVLWRATGRLAVTR